MATVAAPSLDAHSAFLKLLTPTHRTRTSSEISDNLKRLRRVVLVEGIPDGDPLLRARAWKLFLNIHHSPAAPHITANARPGRTDAFNTLTRRSAGGAELMDGDEYLRLVSLGPSSVSGKIKNDTFRTLATDAAFKTRVTEEMLTRCLEAFVWRNEERRRRSAASGGGRAGSGSGSGSESGGEGEGFGYVQGMNVLSAPFLYVLPSELEAYACFTAFIETCCPLYVQPTLQGVHRGLKLLDRCLAAVDRELFEHLRSKNLSAELYAFPSVMTFCAGTPPLDQVLRLWDFLLAFGVHLNILCVIAQMLIMRQDLLDSPSPMKLLRTFPPLDAASVIGITVALVKDLPEELYRDLVAHPFDD